MPRHALLCAAMEKKQESLALAVAEKRGQQQALLQGIIQLEGTAQGAILTPSWLQAMVEMQELTRLLANVGVAIRDLLLQIEEVQDRAADLGCTPRETDSSFDDAITKHLQKAADDYAELLHSMSTIQGV
jgi:hypothetical protein